jgi:TolB-like protein
VQAVAGKNGVVLMSKYLKNAFATEGLINIVFLDAAGKEISNTPMAELPPNYEAYMMKATQDGSVVIVADFGKTKSTVYPDLPLGVNIRRIQSNGTASMNKSIEFGFVQAQACPFKEDNTPLYMEAPSLRVLDVVENEGKLSFVAESYFLKKIVMTPTAGTTVTSTFDADLTLGDIYVINDDDAELKNMSSTDDLTSTKDLNARTKDVNAKRVAIIYFENSSDDPSLNKLKKGLADMMITDLSNINMLNIVERDRLEAILKEQKLSRSSQVDPATAAKVGKLLGAQVILTGGYFEMMGSLRIDARFIDVETGKILKSDGVDGAASSFFKIQKQLSWKIIKNLDTKISDKEKADLTKLENSKNISLEDTKIYSEALDLYDNGKLEQAKTLFDKLITKYPDFQAAKNSRLKIK